MFFSRINNVKSLPDIRVVHLLTDSLTVFSPELSEAVLFLKSVAWRVSYNRRLR